ASVGSFDLPEARRSALSLSSGYRSTQNSIGRTLARFTTIAPDPRRGCQYHPDRFPRKMMADFLLVGVAFLPSKNPQAIAVRPCRVTSAPDHSADDVKA